MLITDLIKTEIDLFELLIDASNFSKDTLIEYTNEHFNPFLTDPDEPTRDLNRVILFGMLLRGFRIKAIKSIVTESELRDIYYGIFEPDYIPFNIFYTFHLLNCKKINITEFNITLMDYIKTLNKTDKNKLSNTLIIYTCIKINYNILENTSSEDELYSIEQMSLFIEKLNKNSKQIQMLDTYISEGKIPRYII